VNHVKGTNAEHLRTLGGLPIISENCLRPWNRVLLGKLVTVQLVKKFPVVYGTRRFITVFTKAHKKKQSETLHRLWYKRPGFDSQQGWRRDHLLHHRVQTGSGVHLVSHPMDTRSTLPWGKVANSSPASRLRMHGAIPPLPYSKWPWRGA